MLPINHFLPIHPGQSGLSDQPDFPGKTSRLGRPGFPGRSGHTGRPGLPRLLLISCLMGISLLFTGLLTGCAKQDAESVLRVSEEADASLVTPAGTTNPYSDLSVPTCITKLGERYYIVDCYHNQILYSDSLSHPLEEWYVMSDVISQGHTIAWDGTVYLADDTENNRVLVYEEQEEGPVLTQVFEEIGTRPHFTVYDELSGCFYVLSSMTGELYVFSRLEDSTQVVLREIRGIAQLDGVYVRSFTILDDEVYFVSGAGSILRARLDDLTILEEYPVPDTMYGMIQLAYIGDYYYLTISTDVNGSQDYATILRTRDLSLLATGDYEDVYDTFLGGGTPYFIGSFDGHYYLTEHRIPGVGIWQFDVTDNEIHDVVCLF